VGIASTVQVMEMNREEEHLDLHRMGKVHNLLEMTQPRQNLRATNKESGAQNNLRTSAGFNSDTE
jgi:hypothetical protein